MRSVLNRNSTVCIFQSAITRSKKITSSFPTLEVETAPPHFVRYNVLREIPIHALKVVKTVPVVCVNLNQIGYIRILSIMTKGLDPKSSLNKLRLIFTKLSSLNCRSDITIHHEDIEYIEYILYASENS